jgi:hypothetical protein
MADQHSFDISSKINLQELDNAINQASREVDNRYDLKGSNSKITFNEKENHIFFDSSDEYKLKAVVDILKQKLVNRGISLKALRPKAIESSLGGRVKQVIDLQQGIEKEDAKKVTAFIKESGLKVQTQIQGDQIRVIAKQIDDLQVIIKKIKEKNFDIYMDFVNFR